jgi:hypothetical protein
LPVPGNPLRVVHYPSTYNATHMKKGLMPLQWLRDMHAANNPYRPPKANRTMAPIVSQPKSNRDPNLPLSGALTSSTSDVASGSSTSATAMLAVLAMLPGAKAEMVIPSPSCLESHIVILVELLLILAVIVMIITRMRRLFPKALALSAVMVTALTLNVGNTTGPFHAFRRDLDKLVFGSIAVTLTMVCLVERSLYHRAQRL